MEIDFLGLNSSSKYSSNVEQEVSKNQEFTDSDNQEIETFLCLSTSSSLDSKKKTCEFGYDKVIPSCSSSSNSTMSSFTYYNNENVVNIEQQPTLVLVPTPLFHHSSTTGFRYDLYEKSTKLRGISSFRTITIVRCRFYYMGDWDYPRDSKSPENISQLPCCTNVYNATLPNKADNTIYFAENVSKEPSSDARNCTRDYTPTIAMARKATLARFLEKRLHRMNQARTSHFMVKNNGRHEPRLQ